MLTILRKVKQCDAFIIGKHGKQTFHDYGYREHRNITLIHFYLCGLMPIISKNGNTYIMNFIDDYTRMCWEYLLKNKSEYFGTLRNFQAWIENDA